MMPRQKKQDEQTGAELLERVYTSVIYYSLSARLPENAIWFAERMRGAFPLLSKATFLLGLSYYRANDLTSCVALLSEWRECYRPNLELLWTCLFELKQYREAEKVLLSLNSLDMEEDIGDGEQVDADVLTDSSRVSMHDASVTALWKGTLLKKTARRTVAVNYFMEALDQNPFLWTAVSQLSELGVNFKEFDSIFSAAKLQEAFDEFISPVEASCDAKKPRDEVAQKVFIELGTMMEHCAIGVNYMSLYLPKDALAAFERLPAAHKETPWVQAQIAKLKTGMNNLRGGKEAFQKLMKLAPYRVKDLDYYSSLLWRLKHDIELSHLAHHLAQINSNAPETWVAIGNLMSLSGQSGNAIRSFKKASELDPSNAYILFLLGKEKMAREPNSKKTLALFQTATRLEPRQWRAWHALGDMEKNAGNLVLALAFYEKSVVINQSNPALYLSIAEVFKAQGRLHEALEMVDHGLSLDKSNVVLMFKKAYYLALIGEPAKSLELLKELESSVARHEVNLFYLMGKMYEQLGNEKDALKAYIQAMDVSRAFASTHGGALQSSDIYSGVPGLATTRGIQTEDGKVSAAAIMGAAFAVEGPGSRTSAVLDKIKEAIDKFGVQLEQSRDQIAIDKSAQSFSELQQLPS